MPTVIHCYTTIIGIDPGLSGGIACWMEDKPLTAFKTPPTEGDLLDLLKTLIVPGKTIAFVEEVGGFAGKQQPGSAMFKFGRNFGFTLGVLQSLQARIELVRPQKWQKPLSLGTAASCASRTEWKNKLKACAQRLYPSLKPTLATADALLILDYGLKAVKSCGGESPCTSGAPATKRRLLSNETTSHEKTV